MEETIGLAGRAAPERPALDEAPLAPPMSQATRVGLAALLAALVLGVLGDALLRALPWGINVFLWIGSLVAAVVALLRSQRLEATGAGRWLVAPVLFFAACMAWRASPTLNALSILAVLVTLALAATHTRAGRLRVAGFVDYLASLVMAGLYGMLGALMLVFGDIQWATIPRTGRTDQAVAIGRGLLLAVPLLLVFGGLFMAADAVFENIVVDLFNWDIDELVSHAFLIAFWGWLVAGFLRLLLLEREPADRKVTSGGFFQLGTIEVGLVLGTLNALFLAFVLVQFRYFFGGAALVEQSISLTYAEYARRGFFELVTVAALLLPLLLGVHWLLRADRPSDARLFRLLAGSLVALLYIIMLSAVQRMRLYQSEFGLTELRLYTTVFMGWLAVVFAWFVATVLRGRRERFIFGALASGLVTLALLHALNPDALIVRTNAGRVGSPEPFDSRYAVSLSADAVPALIRALPTMAPTDQCNVAATILSQWSPPAERDWRTWNWGRAQAWAAVAANEAQLEAVACPQR